MSRFTKSLLITSIINCFCIIYSFYNDEFIIGSIVLFLFEILAGLILGINKNFRETTKGVLVAGALGLLVGFFVCSAQLNKMNSYQRENDIPVIDTLKKSTE